MTATRSEEKGIPRRQPGRRTGKTAACCDLQIQQVALDTLRPSARNPRRITGSQLAALERSISQFGFVDPIVVRKADWTVIGGHQRLEAARRLGLREVPVVLVDLTEDQARLLNLALNKIHGDWDLEQLGEILAELRDLPSLDVTLTEIMRKAVWWALCRSV